MAFASRAMSDTERRYAQIEKEALAVTWSCEKFSDYVLGLTFAIETDHKPLVPLLNENCLNALPPRVLRFRLRLARFDYVVSHVPGKQLYTADTLSRAPSSAAEEPTKLQAVTEAYVKEVAISSLPASSKTLDMYRRAQQDDPVCSTIMQYCQSGWPQRKTMVQADLSPFWKARDYLTVCENLLLYRSRIVIPSSMRRTTMEKIHTGHQGVERCCWRARTSVWWPGVTHQITQMLQQCQACVKEARQKKEPLMPTKLPWQVIGTDLFEIKGVHYLITVDYFSRYPEVNKLTTTTSSAIITALKAVFSRHGLPEVVRSDKGPQYSSHEFARFADSYNFKHVTSSPLYPQSNGQAERAVQTVKNILKQSQDPFMGLLSYRSTPMPWCGLSPAELCMGRRIRTSVPQVTTQLVPTWNFLTDFRRNNEDFKGKQKKNYDSRHGVCERSCIPNDTEVWIQSESEPLPGTIAAPASTPRSYAVATQAGLLRRNTSHLSVVPPIGKNRPAVYHTPRPIPSPNVIMTRSRTCTNCNPRRL